MPHRVLTVIFLSRNWKNCAGARRTAFQGPVGSRMGSSSESLKVSQIIQWGENLTAQRKRSSLDIQAHHSLKAHCKERSHKLSGPLDPCWLEVYSSFLPQLFALRLFGFPCPHSWLRSCPRFQLLDAGLSAYGLKVEKGATKAFQLVLQVLFDFTT